MEPPSRGQLGGGFQNAGDDHGDHQVTLGAPGAGEDGFQASAAKSAQRRGHMTMRSRALDGEGVGGRNEGLALQHPAQGVDLGGGPMGKIGEGAFDDAAIDACGLAEEDSGRGVAVGDGFNVHGKMISPQQQIYTKLLLFTWVQNQLHTQRRFRVTSTTQSV